MMKNNINQIIFGGNCGSDLKQTGNIYVVSVCSTKSWKNKDGTFGERTTWMNVTLSHYLVGKLAAHGGLHKGDQLVVSGEIYVNKKDSTTYTNISVDTIISHIPKALIEMSKSAPQPQSYQQPLYQQPTSQHPQPASQPQMYQQPAPQPAPDQAPAHFYNQVRSK